MNQSTTPNALPPGYATTADANRFYNPAPGNGRTATAAELSAARGDNNFTGGKSPTVMSDSNIRENVIPDIQSKARNILAATTPVTSNANPTRNADGSINEANPGTTGTPTTATDVNSPDYYDSIIKGLYADEGKSLDNDPTTASELSLLDSMKASSDATTQSLLAGITSKYNTRQQAMQLSQKSRDQGLEQALQLGGGNQYAPASSTGIMKASEAADVQALTDLQGKEDADRLNVIESQQKNDYETLGKRIDILDKTRQAKMDLAKKINDDMIKENQTLRTNALQAQKDSAITQSMAKGLTNPVDILKDLNSSGKGVFTADDIAKAIKNLSPTGDLAGLSGSTKDFFILKQKGLLPASVKALPEDQQLFGYMRLEKQNSTNAKDAATSAGAAPKEDVAQGIDILNKNKGSDGFVDPYVYKQMFNLWTGKKYSTESFIKAYPPKYYINPSDNAVLPPYLQVHIDKAASSNQQVP